MTQYDRLEYSAPAKLPAQVGIEPNKGCPYDCGLCTEHEQHTCIGLVEIASSCNLNCPMCFASSGPSGEHLSVADCYRAIDRLVEVEGKPEVLQLSGGEPTIHLQFEAILDYAIAQPIDYVQINTNGIRLAHDTELINKLASCGKRLEVFFQLDGFTDEISQSLRGESLTDIKLRAIEALGAADVHVTLASTLQSGVNDDQLGDLIKFGIERPWITGINLQPATYSGRHVLPEQLEQRMTFPDVIKRIASRLMVCSAKTTSCRCHVPIPTVIAFRMRIEQTARPLHCLRFIDARNNLDMLDHAFHSHDPQLAMKCSSTLGNKGAAEENAIRPWK